MVEILIRSRAMSILNIVELIATIVLKQSIDLHNLNANDFCYRALAFIALACLFERFEKEKKKTNCDEQMNTWSNDILMQAPSTPGHSYSVAVKGSMSKDSSVFIVT